MDDGVPQVEPHAAAAADAEQRRRLRERLRTDDGDSLRDDELIALLLETGPRRDTAALANRLIREFGSVGAICAAPRAALARVAGMNARGIDVLKLARAAAIRLARAEIADRPLLSAWDKVVAYARTELAHGPTERLFVLFLDRRNALIRAEERGNGTVDHAPVYPREVVKRALELGASALILVHNHPSGDPSPSRADIEMTRAVAKACSALGIAVHDHLVIGRTGHASLRALGLM
jgi:DNA repair protein RadC